MAAATPRLDSVRAWLSGATPTIEWTEPPTYPDPEPWNDTWGRVAAVLTLAASGAAAYRIRANPPEQRTPA